ncbi:exocyst complex component Sec [Marssonina coronariae]|uniref:Exocyst complex component Sec n=1 Tax=Diplocarpon coronariae TaxID=2795749 RepID=A0A218Z2Y0_9HELO|nr:hypothetical protein JHW43_001846 [Diplocarpon mali]OWP02419.1 exocyst complex component Sec [Marssonina coronariae]
MASTLPRNFSYPDQLKPAPNKLRWSRSFSLPNMSFNDSSHPGAFLHPPKTREPAARGEQRASIPERRPSSHAALPTRATDAARIRTAGSPSATSPGLRSRVCGLARRIFPAERPPSPPTPPLSAGRPRASRSVPLALPPVLHEPSQAVLVEYLPVCPRLPRRGGVVYLSLEPLDTRVSFIQRARVDGLYGRSISGRGGRSGEDAVRLHVCWNQGSRDERIESCVRSDREFRKAVELMQARGWRDRFQLWHA